MQHMIQSDADIVVCLFLRSGLLLKLRRILVLIHSVGDLEAHNVFSFSFSQQVYISCMGVVNLQS